MKTKKLTKDGDRLAFFASLYNAAKRKTRSDYSLLRAQYDGTRDVDGKSGRFLRNVTYELIESEVSSNVPMPVVKAKASSVRAQDNARKATSLLKTVRDELPFEIMNDEDERNTYIYGGDCYFVEWDDIKKTVKITLVKPENVVLQEGISSVRDMDYVFLRFVDTPSSVFARYGKVVYPNGDAELIEYVMCFFKNDDEKVSLIAFTDSEVLCYYDDYYKARKRVCKNCGESENECACERKEITESPVEEEKIKADIISEDGELIVPRLHPVFKDGVLQEEEVYDYESGEYITVPKLKETTVRAYTPDVFPIVIRKNITGNDAFGVSDAEILWPVQQAINKIERRVLEKLLKAGVIPYSGENTEMRFSDELFTRGVKLKNAQEKSLLGVLDLSVNVSQDVAEAERLYDQAKRIIGITDSYMGLPDDTALSGVAKEMLINQSSARLTSKRVMKNAAYAELDELIFKFYLAFSGDSKLPLKDEKTGAYGESFSRYDYVTMKENGEYAFDDGYLFSIDLNYDVTQNAQSMWSEIKSNYSLGVYGDPSDINTKLQFWKNMELARYPFAKDNIEYLTKEGEENGRQRTE